MPKYKLLVEGSGSSGADHRNTLKEGVKYRLLNYKEALEKAKERGGTSVMFGYDNQLYEMTKGTNKYIYLRKNGFGHFNPLHVGHGGINISVDMVELYIKDIKYNKELL